MFDFAKQLLTLFRPDRGRSGYDAAVAFAGPDRGRSGYDAAVAFAGPDRGRSGYRSGWFGALLIAVGVCAMAMSSHAEYLFWQVTSSTISGDDYLKEHIDTDSLSSYAAEIRYGEGADINSWYVTSSGGSPIGVGDGTIDTAYQVNLANIDNASGYSYFIEIVKYVDGVRNVVAKGETKSYTELVNANYVGDILSPQELEPWTGGTYSVPEPSSAMLMLVGLALAGLKRRRA